MKKTSKWKIIIGVLIIIITTVHYSTGIIRSPIHGFYRLLYFIPVILAAFNFGFKGSIFSALGISLLYSPHILLSLDLSTETLNEFLDILLFFSVGIITGILTEKKNIAYSALDNQLKKYIILEKYTNAIIESIKNGVVAINEDMLITMINQGAKDILNVKGDCLGEDIEDIFFCCKEIKNNIIEAIEKNIIVANIEGHLSINEESLAIRISIFPLNYDSMKKGVVIIIEDITQFKKMQIQLQRNEKLSAVGQLSTGIAHEIRNPLAIIKMIEQTMQKELKDNKEAVKELTIIDEEIERANRVIKSLMEFSKPNKNYKIYCDVNEVIQDVLIIVNKYVSQHKIEVNFNAKELPLIKLDKEQLKQAFVNLIFNAVDAIESEGTISISTEEYDEKWIRIIFKDSGKGINEKDLDKIFNPFFTTKDEGTGLGLSIVHKIIEEHDGAIDVYSQIDKGTSFEIMLPKLERSLSDEENSDSR